MNQGSERPRWRHRTTSACRGSSIIRGAVFSIPGTPSGGTEARPMLPELPNEAACPGSSFSISVTVKPRRTSRNAQHAPTIPPPITIARPVCARPSPIHPSPSIARRTARSAASCNPALPTPPKGAADLAYAPSSNQPADAPTNSYTSRRAGADAALPRNGTPRPSLAPRPPPRRARACPARDNRHRQA